MLLPSADEAEQSVSEQSWPGLFWLPPVDDKPSERAMLHLDDELAGLIEAADTPADQDRTHITKPEASSISQQQLSTTLNLDAERSGLVPSEDAEPAEHAMLDLDAEMSGLAPPEDGEPAAHAMPDPHEGVQDVAKLTAAQKLQTQGTQSSRLTADVDDTVADLASSTVSAAVQALSYAPASSSVVISQVDRLGVNDEMSGLIAAAATSADESDHKHSDDVQPSHITANAADGMSNLASSAVAEAAQPDAAAPQTASSSAGAFVQQSAVELSSPNQHADRSVATSGCAAIVYADAGMSSFAPSHDAEPAEHAMLSLDAEMSGLAPQEDAEHAGGAMPDPHAVSEPAPSDSYEDDTFDDLDLVPAVEAVEAAAVNSDVPLDSIYEADTFEAAEGADTAAAEESSVVMPERPAGPVAMQLASAAAATAVAAVTLHDTSAPASLAGDQAVISDQAGDDDAYDDDVFEAATAAQTDTKSEDGLVSSAQQPAGDEEVGSEAGSTASSDLDDVTQAEAQADAEQAFDTHADESHENEAFGMEAEQSELQTEDSQAQASGELSSSRALPVPEASAAHASAAQHSAAQVLATQDSATMASAPQPPPMRNLGEVRRPARPSRAFIRHAISLTQPDAQDSSGAGLPAATPMPAVPQAPAGNPPRHRWARLFVFILSCALCKPPHAVAQPAHAVTQSAHAVAQSGAPVADVPVLADIHCLSRSHLLLSLFLCASQHVGLHEHARSWHSVLLQCIHCAYSNADLVCASAC